MILLAKKLEKKIMNGFRDRKCTFWDSYGHILLGFAKNLTFSKKHDCIILHVLWYSIFIQKKYKKWLNGSNYGSLKNQAI